MGSSKKQTVSYWYHPTFQMVLHEGPFDKLLEIRGGDVTAWKGVMTASGSIQIDAANIWGGDEKEGGIQGTVDVSFGEMDAQPNAYFQTAIGADPSGHNGYALLQFNGGRYGAGNPYPKPISVLTERLYQGWLDDAPWYPERVAVLLRSLNRNMPSRVYFALDCSSSMAGTKIVTLRAAMVEVLNQLEAWVAQTGLYLSIALVPFSSNTGAVMQRDGAAGADFDAMRDFVNGLAASGGTNAMGAFGPLPGFFSGSTLNNVAICVSDGAMSSVTEAQAHIEETVLGQRVLVRGIGIQTVGSLGSFDNSGEAIPVVTGDNVAEMANAVIQTLSRSMSYFGMNPAHVIYDSLVYLQGEPVGMIDEASFRAAADALYAEGFGICTKYDHDRESIDQFRQRMLDLIGAECSRYNGRWYLDLIRPLTPEQIDALPVLGDDDILDWEEDVATIDDMVNQVSVKWFDPLTKQERVTAPVHALAAINAMGAVSAEIKQYLEVPYENLANRLAARDLQNKSTPTRRLRLTTNRRPYIWRKGHAFRLQAPKRGISDMVCRVAEIDRGTLQSGAIRLVAVQDVFAMPETTYVVEQPPIPPPSQVPVAIEDQKLFEAPYVELAGLLSPAELEALDEEAGYVMAVGARPGIGQGYALLTRPAGGNFERAGIFDWCPSALVVEGAGRADTSFTLSEGSYLDRVDIGSAALWGDELVRVDALDPGTGAVEFGRGCGDTVPQQHEPGERVWFFDGWSASDRITYATSESVEAKLLTRTGSQELPESAADTLSVVLDKRAARPYPPANPKVDADPAPASVAGEFVVTWANRDRIQQADQLVDATVGSIGPEPTGRIALRVLDGSENVLAEKLDIAGTTATVDLDYTGPVTLELFAINDYGESLQRHVLKFDYTKGSATENTIVADTYEPPYTIIDGGEVVP